MKGSVFKRGKTWTVLIGLGRDGTGKRMREWHSGFATKKEADKARVEILHRIATGTHVPRSKQSVAAFLKEWLEATRPTIRESTWESYGGLIRTHITPRLGSIILQELTASKLNAFYAELLSTGRHDGTGGLSPKTVRNVHVVLRKALSDAARWGLLTRNVAELADPPKLRNAGSVEMQTWTAEEIRGFLDHIEKDRLFAAWMLSVATGMRRGEILGLRWQDVDLDARTLAVRQTLLTVDYKLTFSTPKTNRSRRVIALDDQTVAALRSYRARQLEERLAWGPAYVENELVFTRENGEPIHPDRFSQMFDKHVKESGLPRIRLHDLRHTHATLALQAGVHPKVVSERLGHSTVAFTMDVYSHVIPAMQADAADKVAALIFGNG